MRTQIYVTTKSPDQLAQDLVAHRWSDFHQGSSEHTPRLKHDPISGYEYYEHQGRLFELPYVLDDLAVVQVVIRQRHQHPGLRYLRDIGPYKASRAFGNVEYNGTEQYIEVVGETLEAANMLMDAIITETIKPTKVTVEPVDPMRPFVNLLIWIITLGRRPFANQR